MARASSGLAYPERFYAAAAYAGFGDGSNGGGAASKFQNDVALLLYGLYQQVRDLDRSVDFFFFLVGSRVWICDLLGFYFVWPVNWSWIFGVFDGFSMQATVGTCNTAKPRAWNPVEHSKWTRLVIFWCLMIVYLTNYIFFGDNVREKLYLKKLRFYVKWECSSCFATRLHLFWKLWGLLLMRSN